MRGKRNSLTDRGCAAYRGGRDPRHPSLRFDIDVTVSAQRKISRLGFFKPHATYGTAKLVVAENSSPFDCTISLSAISCGLP